MKPKGPTRLPVLNLIPNGNYVQVSSAAIELLEIDLKAPPSDRLVGFAYNSDSKGMYIVSRSQVGYLLGTNQRINDQSLRVDLCTRLKLDTEKKHRLMLDVNLVTKANGCKAILLVTPS